MSNVLLCNGDPMVGADADVEWAVPGGHPIVYATFEVYITTAALAQLESDHGSQVPFIGEIGAGGTNDLYLKDTGAGTLDGVVDDLFASPTAGLAGSAWNTVGWSLVPNGGTLHQRVNATDDTQVFTGFSEGDITYVKLGAMFRVDEPVYIRTIKIGTTPGGSDILNYDPATDGDPATFGFTITGDVTLVADPDPPVPPPPASVVQRGVCLAFDAAAMDESPTWTSLADIAGIELQAWSIDRGRSFEFDQTKTGTMTCTVFDHQGVLDATNAFSPYAGKINPLMQIAVFLTDPVDPDHPEAMMFRGFVENIETVMDVSMKFMIHTISAVDGFDIVGNAEVIVDGTTGKATYAAGAVDTRIGAALTDAGWPGGLRRIFSGNVNDQETVYEPGDKLLSVVFDAADSEFPGVANIYMDKEGNFTFHGRKARFDPTNPDYDINSWKAGDGAAADLDVTVAQISSMSFDRAKAHIFNAVLATPQNIANADITGQIVTDAPSIAVFGVRSDSHMDLVTAGGETDGLDANEETAVFATYEVANYKIPRTRVNRLGFRIPRDSAPNLAAWWAMTCGADISDVVLLMTTHVGGGGFNENFFIEGVRISAKPLRDEYPELDVEYDLSPAAYYSTDPFG